MPLKTIVPSVGRRPGRAGLAHDLDQVERRRRVRPRRGRPARRPASPAGASRDPGRRRCRRRRSVIVQSSFDWPGLLSRPRRVGEGRGGDEAVSSIDRKPGRPVSVRAVLHGLPGRLLDADHVLLAGASGAAASRGSRSARAGVTVTRRERAAWVASSQIPIWFDRRSSRPCRRGRA